MGLNEIRAALEQRLKDGKLLLAHGIFDELDHVLEQAGRSTVEVLGAGITPSGPVIVTGTTLAFGGDTAGAIELQVTDDPGVVARLKFTAPADWAFASTFPGLPQSYRAADLPGLITLDESALYWLPFTGATLTTLSTASGIDFVGTLRDADAFGILAQLLDLDERPVLTGQITLHPDAPPTPDLRIKAGTGVLPIGDLLRLKDPGIRVQTVAHDLTTDGPLTLLALAATLDVGTTEPLPIDLSAPLYGEADTLQLIARFGPPGLSVSRGIRAFAELLELPATDFTLPAPLDILDTFRLQSIACSVQIKPASVERLEFVVGPDEHWQITPDIAVDDLTIGWYVGYPFSAELRSVFAVLTGTLAIGTVEPKLEFDIEASTMQGFAISGGLAHARTLREIATTINGAPVEGLPELSVVDARISASSEGDLSLLVEVADWKLGSVGDVPVELTEVALALSRNSSQVRGHFVTIFGVGSVRVLLQAELKIDTYGQPALDAAGETSWVFTGGTQPNTTIPVGELLSQLADFGIDKVPEPIRTLSLKDLKLTYDTAKKRFTFGVEADFDVNDTPVALTIGIVVQPTEDAPVTNPPSTVKGTKGYSATFTGQVTWSGVQFDLVFDVGATGKDVFIADYVNTSDRKLTSLRELVAEVAPASAEAIPAGIELGLDEVKFVFIKQTASQWAFGVRLGAAFDLSELPIVGSKLPADSTLSIEQLQILYSSVEMKAPETELVNRLLPKKVAPLPPTVGKGIAFDADLRLGDRVKHVHAGVTPPPATLPATVALRNGVLPLTVADAVASAPASSTDPVKWFDVDKQFGIFSFKRVGLGYIDNRLSFALDASVALGPIAFWMDGLTVGSPLDKVEPHFDLKGLALAFERPPVKLGGAFLRAKETVGDRTFDSYYGQVGVQVGQFGLRALGGWAPDADPSSFFLYLSIDAPIGGPPFLFVTGIAAGFGVNSALTLPTIDKVGQYPLLPGPSAPKEQATPAETIKAVIPALQEVFHPQAGQYWIAAGVAVTSFEMIKARAVISVSFGVELQIGVVGTCSMTLPTGDPEPIAYVEIDVVASFTPSTGLLSIDGKLSPASYLFGGFVKITGGFAFYAWFSGEHAGDFVVTLGGYHPAFERPSNYPVVPRLELSFALGPLKVVGQTYFALTPCGFMAGLQLRATFAAGPVKAWFDAGIDVLLMWAPFHYEAGAWVTIGCSVDLGLFTISVQIGAEFRIWGPSFGGLATIDLDVVSFTIGFGADRRAPLPIGWNTLTENFLPAATKTDPAALATRAGLAAPAAGEETNILTASVRGTTPQGVAPAGIDWILDPNDFVIETSSAVPANRLRWDTGATEPVPIENVPKDFAVPPAPPLPVPAPKGMALTLERGARPLSTSHVWQPVLNIAPMDLTDVRSYLTIGLRRQDPISGKFTKVENELTLAPRLSPATVALWGETPADGTPKPNEERLVPSALVGVALSPVPRDPSAVNDVPLLELIYGPGHETGVHYSRLAPDTRYRVDGTLGDDELDITISGDHTAALTNVDYELSALTNDWVDEQRRVVLDELRALGFDTPPAGAVSVVGLAKTALTDWPSVALIGAQA